MGTKRVGLARVQALIENLKRELDLNGASFAGGLESAMEAPTDSTTALTAADSGKVVFLAANDAQVELPDTAVGLCYKIILADDYSTAVSKVTAKAGQFMAGGVSAFSTNQGNEANGSSNVVATFGSATLAGDYIDLHCDGTKWYVRGQCAADSNGIAFSNS